VRLYFEVRDLDEFCRRLQRRGFQFVQLPTMMPWGWRHAYLNDPEGHEISLYWAGENRRRRPSCERRKKWTRYRLQAGANRKDTETETGVSQILAHFHTESKSYVSDNLDTEIRDELCRLLCLCG